MNSRIFETLVKQVMTESVEYAIRQKGEPVYTRLTRYLEESFRDGVIGQGRYVIMLGKARKLQRFLIIKGLSAIRAREFTADLLLEYRQFIYDEYLMCRSSHSFILRAMADMRLNVAVRTPPSFTT